MPARGGRRRAARPRRWRGRSPSGCGRARRPRRRRRSRRPCRRRRRSARARRPARPRPGGRMSGETSASLRRCRIADRGDRAHHRDLGAGPGEHLGRAERAGVHGDVGAAVRLAGDQGDPRHHALAEGVQQLGAAAYHAVPLLADAGQVAGHVDDARSAARRTRRTCARSGTPSRPRASRGSRRGAAGCWRRRRRCGRRSGPARSRCWAPSAACSSWIGALVEDVLDERVHVVGALLRLRQQRSRSTVVDVVDDRGCPGRRAGRRRRGPGRAPPARTR